METIQLEEIYFLTKEMRLKKALYLSSLGGSEAVQQSVSVLFKLLKEIVLI